jgi:hypothetical protein
MASTHPYYHKRLPSPKKEKNYIGDGTVLDLNTAHLEETATDRVPAARASFDDRAAAAVRAAAAIDGAGDVPDDIRPPKIWPAIVWVLQLPAQLPLKFNPDPNSWFKANTLLEFKWYDGDAPTIHIPRSKCLALLSYLDYFPDNPRVGLGLRSMVSRAVLSASPGWCGTFGPGVDGTFSLKGAEGNYDLSQMHLVPMAYRHYDDLSPAARELLITQLLARGRAHRPDVDDTFTSGGNPNDWTRAGFVSPAGYHIDIGETENHVLMIVTARYLTNQLLFQRNGGTEHDNRRNGDDDRWSCFSLLLYLLRNMLRGDFSEYNAKSYQSETRWALLNLCTYAYDHEIRLGARMVLDYRAAHIAVSSNDLRRLVPFRRRFNDDNAQRTADEFMTGGLLTENHGDPMAAYFAMQAGNIRSYDGGSPPSFKPFSIGDVDVASDVMVEVLSDYRIPPSIHDLFVNDQSRRFFQRLHRTVRDEVGGNRNCDNMEIYASSPSYLITAGGAPATWALDPGVYGEIDGETVSQELGVALTTSFIPTGFVPTGLNIQGAGNLIQFGSFSTKRKYYWRLKVVFFDALEGNIVQLDNVENYGVAPDFACGHQIYLPLWLNVTNVEGVKDGMNQDPRKSQGFSFFRSGSEAGPQKDSPGFYLAIYQETPGGFALMEALDTWLHPVRFSDFKKSVLARNASLRVLNNVPTQYTTYYNNVIDLVVWSNADGHNAKTGAAVTAVRYNVPKSVYSLGNADQITNRLLNGTIMNSPEEAKIEITNPSLGTKLTLDFSDSNHPMRFDSQTGEFEVAGFHNEVWLDFEYSGDSEGDVCRPFRTLSDAVSAVADRGVIRIVPGATRERGIIGGAKGFKLFAPIGGVTIGTADPRQVVTLELLDGVSDRNVWVQFDWFPAISNQVPYLFPNIGLAMDAVADGGVINIEPGKTPERLTIGRGKRFKLVAPIGGVKIGVD